MPPKSKTQDLAAQLRAMFKALEARPVPARLRESLDEAPERETPQRQGARKD